MNTNKSLIGFLLLALAALPGCSQSTDSVNAPGDSDANTPATTQSTAGTEAPSSPRMLPTAQQMAKTQDTEAQDTETQGTETQDQTSTETIVDDSANQSATDPDKEPVNNPIDVDQPETPSAVAAKLFAAPTGAKSLSKRNLWVDPDAGRVYADGYIAMNDGPLEMFACPAGTKEHESIIATLAKASELHAGLLAVDAQVGTPVTYNPSFIPATGQRIRVWVCYFDEEEKYQVTDARQWIVRTGTTQTLKEDWVFAGSYIWTDPVDSRNYYQGDVGDMICVSNFTTAMMDIPVVSSADTDQLEYSPNTSQIPKRGTPVRLILEPIPLPADGKETPDAPKPPTADALKKRQ